ncbi:hypothetical protein [Methylocella silvestris]|uniref:hypothetical protein n=1 Tax=Methylocella silvestris TaxID=199596 RepID=UPI0002DDFA58|nr:hypothetical protein [Methylocella silvestris]
MALIDDRMLLQNFPASVTVSSRVQIRERAPVTPPGDKPGRHTEATAAARQASGPENAALRGRPHL